MFGRKIITKKYFILLASFTCFHSAYHGEQPPTISPPFHAIDSSRRNVISLVDFQHKKMCSVLQTSIVATFNETWMVNIKTCKMPRSRIRSPVICTYEEPIRPRAMPLKIKCIVVLFLCMHDSYGAPLCGPSGRWTAPLLSF